MYKKSHIFLGAVVVDVEVNSAALDAAAARVDGSTWAARMSTALQGGAVHRPCAASASAGQQAREAGGAQDGDFERVRVQQVARPRPHHKAPGRERQRRQSQPETLMLPTLSKDIPCTKNYPCKILQELWISKTTIIFLRVEWAKV